MDRSLDSLSVEFQPLVFQVLARLVERGVMVMVVQTSRTVEEHRANLKAGTSRTALSKHLPRSIRGFTSGGSLDKADAIDLCPYDTYQVHGPDKLAWTENVNPETAAAFQAIGEIGERFGLRWGGRWHDPHDPGHLEYVFPAPPPGGPA